MSRLLYCLFVYILFLKSLGAFSQQVSFSGYVVDAGTNEKLIGATIYDVKSKRGVVANEYGYFSLKTSEEHQLDISFVGYSPKRLEGKLVADTFLTVHLVKGLEIDEVLVASDRKNTFGDGLSIMKLNPEMIKSIPALFGESDVLKAIQLQPGTQPAQEGTSGFSVRGGSNDQNLFLLDGIPVYNVNHLFGFFSVFSPDAINSCEYVKGAMPARYGGRLSSVIDLRLKEGNNDKLKGQITAGLIASSIALDGPIIKDKCSFIVTARRTYLDIFSRPISYFMTEQQAGYYFQDITFKTNYVLNHKNKFYLRFYGGNDNAFINYRDKDETNKYISKFNLGWGNKILALRWNSILGKSLFSNTTIYYSNYKYNTGYKDEVYSLNPNSLTKENSQMFFDDVNDIGLKWDLDYYANNQLKLRTGFETISHNYIPGASNVVDFDETSNLRTEQGGIIKNIELSTYIEMNYHPNSKLNFNFGLRSTSSFLNSYTKPILQPRLLANYNVNNHLSFSASYDVNAQYIHLVANSSYSTPTDLWLPVMEGIPPQRAKQFAFGCNFQSENGISFGVDLYYKELEELLEFKPTEIIDHTVTHWPDVILTGEGTAKGIEFMVEKSIGNFTGWLAYTLSKSERKFEAINNGNVFPYKYDRPHNISLVSSYQIDKNKKITASWVYMSGFNVTLNYNYYSIFLNGYEKVIKNYGNRNNYRTPAYHRLDLAYSVSKQKKRGKRTWIFGMYNAYNQINPFTVRYSVNEPCDGQNTDETLESTLQISGLFPIIPSVSYRFDF